MRRSNRSKPNKPPPQLPTPEAPAAEQPLPKGMMDLEAARFWAGRGPARKNRPAYAIMGGDDYVDPPPR